MRKALRDCCDVIFCEYEAGYAGYEAESDTIHLFDTPNPNRQVFMEYHYDAPAEAGSENIIIHYQTPAGVNQKNLSGLI